MEKLFLFDFSQQRSKISLGSGQKKFVKKYLRTDIERNLRARTIALMTENLARQVFVSKKRSKSATDRLIDAKFSGRPLQTLGFPNFTN